MKTLVVIAVLLLGASAQMRRCDSPDTWEAQSDFHDHDRHVYSYAKTMYDGPNERIRRVEKVAFRTDGNKTAEDFFDVIYLHREGMEVRLNLKTKVCNVTELSRPFRPFGIPPNAMSMGQGYLGSSFNGVLVDFWHAQEKDSFWVGQFTTRDCLPVRDEIYSKYMNASQHFYDITLGLSDPNAFTPPTECKKPFNY